MASIWWEESVSVSADAAWQALRRPEQAHAVFAPVLVGCTVVGGVRTVTFGNGLIAEERIVDIDDERRRISYTVMGDTFDHHSASMQLVAVDAATCLFVWVSDFLPAERKDMVLPLVKQGARALAQNLEQGLVPR